MVELVFGTASMSYPYHHSKLHVIPCKATGSTDIKKGENCLIFSKIFSPVGVQSKIEKSKNEDTSTIEKSFIRTETGYSSYTESTESKSGENLMNMHSDDKYSTERLKFADRRDSGVGTSASDLLRLHSEPSGIFRRAGSASSMHLRMVRDAKTSLSTGDLERHSNKKQVGQTKFGLVIIIDCAADGKSESSSKKRTAWWMDRLDILEFFFFKLKEMFFTALQSSENFLGSCFDALNHFRMEMNNLIEFDAPKNSKYTWLKLNRICSREYVTEMLVNPVMHIVGRFDRKETNFFLSRLLTAVLTYHLGWVATVAPLASKIPGQHDDDSEQSKSARNLSYNPIWGQISELYGAIGYPARLARTVIITKKHTNIDESLTGLLAYVMRCSQVKKNSYKIMSDYMPSQLEGILPLTEPLHNTKTMKYLRERIKSAIDDEDPPKQLDLKESLESKKDFDRPTESAWMLDENSPIIIDKKSDISVRDASDNSSLVSSKSVSDEALEENTGSTLTVSTDDTKRKDTTGKKLSIQEFDPASNAEVISLPVSISSNLIEHSSIVDGLFGGYSEKYSSLYVLQITPDHKGVKQNLKNDLKVASNMSLSGRLIKEAIAIVANTDDFQIDVVSSGSNDNPKEKSTHKSLEVCMSLMVSGMVEKLMECVSNDSAELLLNCFEYHLRKIYMQSHILADFLLESTRNIGDDKGVLSITQLKNQYNIDTSDIPLLFSVATTHSPEIADMFGYY